MSSGLGYRPEEAIAYLSRRDRHLGSFIRKAGPFGLEPAAMPGTFEYLCRAVVYQQLSTKAAATIHGRLRDLFPGRRLTPSLLISLSDEALRGAGLSRSKVAAVKDLAAHAAARRLPGRARLDRMDDEAVIEALTRVRGIGRWTVEMLLMFALGRPDVLPVGDLGIAKAIQRAYRLRKPPTAEKMLAIGRRWEPYRSVASWYLWQSLDVVVPGDRR